MGFTEVYDYVDGQLDWLAAGFRTEGTNAERPRAGDVARREVPTCHLDEPIGEVRKRVRDAGWDACVVVNEERVVLGLLREAELEKGSDEPVERVMRPPVPARSAPTYRLRRWRTSWSSATFPPRLSPRPTGA